MATRKHTLTCFCENSFEVNFPELIDLEESPETEQAVFDGTFMSFACPHCGKMLKPEFTVRLRDKDRGIDIAFLPESERDHYLSGKSTPPDGERIVIGYKELKEKLAVFSRSLDDRIIEIIKLQLLQKAGKNSDIQIYFDSLENEQLTFYIHGLKQDEIGVAKIPEKLYRKIEAELEVMREDPSIQEIMTPPYVSINKVYIGEE